MDASLAPNSKKVYKRAWNLLLEFSALRSIPPLPLDLHQTSLFVSFLWSKNFSYSTIRSYLSATSYFHKINSLPDNTSAFVIQKALVGINNLSKSPTLRRPITLPMLWAMLEKLAFLQPSDFYIALYRSMFTFAFYALCRISEITYNPATQHNLFLADVQLLQSPKRFQITFQSFKHSSSPQSIFVHIQNPPQSCPVRLLEHYLSLRGQIPGPLFQHTTGQPVSRLQFNTALQACLSAIGMSASDFKSHSFRIGGATHAAHQGLSSLQIRALGRWRSDAFMKYIRWS